LALYAGDIDGKRSREVFIFPRPETLAEWLPKPESLRARLHDIPALNPAGFRDCQIHAIENLENSFNADKPRALIQMTTGAGKTFTAITSVYRLLKFADAKRIRREKEQTIDHDNLDTVLRAEWDGDAKENAQNLTKDFAAYLKEYRDNLDVDGARQRIITFVLP
jgi:Type III restriction enzyme, res subunit